MKVLASWSFRTWSCCDGENVPIPTLPSPWILKALLSAPEAIESGMVEAVRVIALEQELGAERERLSIDTRGADAEVW